MDFLSKLFGKNSHEQECPRCLGKGHVDTNDIVRLNKELKWSPGTCAYCNGTGKVDSELEKNIPVNTSYLTTDLDAAERDRILKGDASAWNRAKEFDAQADIAIAQICYLHFNCSLTVEQIVEFYLLNPTNSTNQENERQELIDYIRKVIDDRVRKN